MSMDYPECSGNRYCCPENDGHGCCGKDPSIERVIEHIRKIANGIQTHDDMVSFLTMANVIENNKSSLDEHILFQDQEIDSLETMIEKLRAGMQEIYRLRGEDELIKNICSPLIDATRGIG